MSSKTLPDAHIILAKVIAHEYKARAPIGFQADNKKDVSSRSVFACFNCLNLFASDYLKRLGCGEYYTMDDTSKFYPAVQIIDIAAINI